MHDRTACLIILFDDQSASQMERYGQGLTPEYAMHCESAQEDCGMHMSM